MNERDENGLRKQMWLRKDAVDEKTAEPGFASLPADEQDAWVVSLQLGVSFADALACVTGTAAESVVEDVRAKIAESFKFGKRKALRALRDVLSRRESLRTERTGEE